MSKANVAVEKLERIQELWREIGRTGANAPEYETLLKKIRVLSAEYQELVDAARKPKSPK
jgi:hypothetical protein